MEAQRINIAEWEYFGEGGSSTSYVNKKNGNLIVKLNNKDIPVEITEKEFLASKAFNDAGFPSPAIYDFVTDGERFGYTGQRIKGKQSFARTLSQEPGSAGRLARRFASLASDLHRTPADITRMTDARRSLLETMGDLSYVPRDVADIVMKCFTSISGDTVCLHGDLNPSNLISFEGKDSWIGVNDFSYGDPFLDIATLHIICYFLPSKVIENLYHADRGVLRTFFTEFKKAYFGESYGSKEIEDRINDAAIVKFCAAAVSHPEYSDILVPLVRGRKLRMLIKRGL